MNDYNIKTKEELVKYLWSEACHYFQTFENSESDILKVTRQDTYDNRRELARLCVEFLGTNPLDKIVRERQPKQDD